MKKNLIKKYDAILFTLIVVLGGLFMLHWLPKAHGDPAAATYYPYNGAASATIASGTTVTLSRLGSVSTYQLTLGSGTAPYTAALVLSDTGVHPGDKYDVAVSYPGSGYPSLQIFDSSTNGTVLHSSTDTAVAGKTVARFVNQSGTQWTSTPEGALLARNAGISGTTDFYIMIRRDGNAGSGTLLDPWDGSAIQVVHTYIPPGAGGTFNGYAVPASVTSTCATRFDARIQDIVSSRAPHAVLHIGAGVFYTAGMEANGVPEDNGAHAFPYYNEAHLTDGMVVKGSGKGVTIIRLMPNAIVSDTVCGTGTSTSCTQGWQTFGVSYDGQGPNTGWSFSGFSNPINTIEVDDLTVDANIQNQAGVLCAYVKTLNLLGQNITLQNLDFINFGKQLNFGAYEEFVISLDNSTAPATVPPIVYVHNCSISGTMNDWTWNGFNTTTNGAPGTYIEAIFDQCSANTTGTNPLKQGFSGETGSNGYTEVRNCIASDVSEGFYADTGVCDNVRIVNSHFNITSVNPGGGYSPAAGVMFNYGTTIRNTLVAGNVITLGTLSGESAFEYNGAYVTGRITGNTVLAGTTGQTSMLFGTSLSGSSIQIDNNLFDPSLSVSNSGTIAFTGFNNYALTGSSISALNTVSSGGSASGTTLANGTFTTYAPATTGTAVDAVVSGTFSVTSATNTLTTGTFGKGTYVVYVSLSASTGEQNANPCLAYPSDLGTTGTYYGQILPNGTSISEPPDSPTWQDTSDQQVLNPPGNDSWITAMHTPGGGFTLYLSQTGTGQVIGSYVITQVGTK